MYQGISNEYECLFQALKEVKYKIKTSVTINE